MNNFIKFLARLFLLPFIYLLIVIAIDPMNYFYISKNNIKYDISRKENKALYDLINISKEPITKIMIGDSRIGNLDINYINDSYDDEYKIISLPKAKINEINDIFNYISNNNQLNEVVIGLNFNMFNDYAYSNRTTEIISMIDQPLRYIFNLEVSKVLVKIILNKIFKNYDKDTKPAINKEIFWTNHINTVSHWQYGRYRYPQRYERLLEKIDMASKKKNIVLKIIVFPHHLDDQQVLVKKNLVEEKKRFYEFLQTLDALVINYDYINSFSNNKDFFKDPIHTSLEYQKLIVDDFFSNSFNVGLSSDDEYFVEKSIIDLRQMH